MTETTPPIVAPRLGDSYVAEMEAQLDRMARDPDPLVQEMHRRQRALLDAGKAASAYQPPAADPRSPAQILHDRHHSVMPREPGDYAVELPPGFEAVEGVAPGEIIDGARNWLAALQIDPITGAAILRDILSVPEELDQEKVKAALDATSIGYDRAVRDAEYALQHAGREFGGITLKVTDMPPFALAQLAIWGARLRTHAVTRPR